ncbi:DUF4142 domain-containing protein [Sphingobacterium lactis]|uniref:DUF4142 domain-containing protein n=1 Tax=Sphingobacterium lactis TaxID=797291 RepID=UPI003DA2D3D0
MKTILRLMAIILGVMTILAFKPQDSVQQFIDSVIKENMRSIALAKQALATSSSEAVKTYAQASMDHSEMLLTELEAFTKTKNYGFSKTVKPADQDKVQVLDSLKKDSFDQAYRNAVVDANRDLIALLEAGKMDEKIQDAELKTWIDGKLPGLKEQLSRGEALTISTEAAIKDRPQMPKLPLKKQN